MILIMSFLHTKGPFCRDCGLAVFRDMTAKTLIGGWWGYISFIATPITVSSTTVVTVKNVVLPKAK